MGRKIGGAGLAGLIFALGCSANYQAEPKSTYGRNPDAGEGARAKDDLLPALVAKPADRVGGRLDKMARQRSEVVQEASPHFMQLASEPPPPPPPGAQSGADAGAEEAERARSWFPEAFLWQPELVTSADGTAQLDVTVPDQLTTWRVLALAHDGRGQQAGTVRSFDSTLPLYVEPVVPGWLYTGDRVVLPVQVVNTTPSPVSATVSVQARGAMAGAGTVQLALGPMDSLVRTLPFEVTGTGTAEVEARLQTADGTAVDTAIRPIPVLAAGKPIERTRAGTLASARTFRLPPPADGDPATEQLEVLVFPGPLSVLQLEHERLLSGARPEDPAYGYALAGALAEMAAAAHVELDAAALRKSRLLAWQRISAAARTTEPAVAAELLASLHGLEEGEQSGPLADWRPRWIQRVRSAQRADGTWSRWPTSTLQGVLVETAMTARVLPEDERGPRLRAQAALERHIGEVNDPYTASVLLASGLVGGDLQEPLLSVLTDAIGTDESGEPVLTVAPEVWASLRTPQGSPPSRVELLAWAVLALPNDHPARGDFVTQILQGWSKEQGFGAGRADALALAAIGSALGHLSAPLEVSLQLDGQVVATSTLDPGQPKVPARLQARPEGRDAEITLLASTATPGLAFVATRRSYVPWSEADRVAGVEVTVTSGTLTAGREGRVSLVVAAPSGASITLSQPLPSGTLLGEDASERASEVGATLRERPDRVEIVTRPFEPGEIFTLDLPVLPTYAGRFQTAPLLVSVDGGPPVPLKPLVWTVGTGN